MPILLLPAQVETAAATALPFLALASMACELVNLGIAFKVKVVEHDNDAPQGRAAESGYDDPPAEFIDQVMSMVEAIPPGQVMTYGDIATILTARAEFAGIDESYGPRMVGYVMSRFGGTLPWWRVIRATGHPPKFHQERALPFYQQENTPLIGPEENYRIDLKRARFHPDRPDERPRQASFS